MPKCPKCQEQINSVVVLGNTQPVYDVSLEEGELRWEQVDEISDQFAPLLVSCPVCEETLPLDNESSIREYLTGGVK